VVSAIRGPVQGSLAQRQLGLPQVFQRSLSVPEQISSKPLSDVRTLSMRSRARCKMRFDGMLTCDLIVVVLAFIIMQDG